MVLKLWRELIKISRPLNDLDIIQSQPVRPKVAYNNFCQKYRNPNGASVLANKLRQFRENPKLRYLTMIVVEGIDDAYFFNDLLDDRTIQLFIACGKPIIKGAFNIIEKDPPIIEGFLAILDADYDDFLESKKISDNNIIMTGNRDLEIKLLNSQALDKFLKEYGNKQKIISFLETVKISHIRNAIFRSIYELGCLRIFNERTKLPENQALNLDEIKLRLYINPKNLSLDLEKYIQELITKSPANHFSVVQLIQNTIEIVKENITPIRVCRGHDAIEILKIALECIFGNGKAINLSTDDICERLRLIYTKDDFQSTILYNRLKEWEANNSPYNILN